MADNEFTQAIRLFENKYFMFSSSAPGAPYVAWFNPAGSALEITHSTDETLISIKSTGGKALIGSSGDSDLITLEPDAITIAGSVSAISGSFTSDVGIQGSISSGLTVSSGITASSAEITGEVSAQTLTASSYITGSSGYFTNKLRVGNDFRFVGAGNTYLYNDASSGALTIDHRSTGRDFVFKCAKGGQIKYNYYALSSKGVAWYEGTSNASWTNEIASLNATGDFQCDGSLDFDGDGNFGGGSTHKIICNGRLILRQFSAPAPTLTIPGSSGEIAYDTYDDCLYYCAISGSPGQWHRVRKIRYVDSTSPSADTQGYLGELVFNYNDYKLWLCVSGGSSGSATWEVIQSS